METKAHSIKVSGKEVYVDGVLMDPEKTKISIRFSTPMYDIEFDLKDNPIFSFEGAFSVAGEST
jgi:hypothetical protein